MSEKRAQNSEGELYNANILLRGCAYLIDCVLVFAIFVVTQYTLFALVRQYWSLDTDWFRSGFNTECYTLLTISIPVYLYFAIFESSAWQATPGKKSFGLVVAGRSASFASSFLRIVVKLLPWELAHIGNNLPTPLWYTDEPGFRVAFAFSGLLTVIYIVSILIDKKQRAPHDWIAGTIVLMKNK